MKRQTKRHVGLLLLGSTALIAGTALYLYLDENARENVEGMINREKAKSFVRHHLGGSNALVKSIDKLSDVEVNTLVKLSDSVDGLKDNVEDVKENVEDTVSDWLGSARRASKFVSEHIQEYL